MTRHTPLATLVLLSGFTGLGSAWPARAELVNCAAIAGDSSVYKVVLDELRPLSGAANGDPAVEALKERLEFNLTGQLASIQAEGRRLAEQLHVPLESVTCTGRQPSFTGSEFTPQIAAILSDHRVVVEMWGTLDTQGGTAGVSAPRARIGYLIPPVRHYVTADAAPAFLVIAYPRSGGGTGTVGLESLRELSAFALIGLGTKAARARSYDVAVWAFTRAEASVREAKLESADAALDDLLRYVKLSACETRSQARADSTYHGPLTLVPATNCAGGS